MRYFILETIKPEEGQPLDNLAHLFNAYLGRLHLLETSVMPRHSMREFARLWAAKPTPRHDKQERKDAQHLASHIPDFYHLQLLSNALHGLHRDVVGAINKLEELFTTYGGDTQRYAVENRLRCIDEYGSDDDSDWEEDGVDAQGQPRWKVAYKADAVSLSAYTVEAELGRFFAGTADWHGEHIGSSGPEDYARFTRLVTASSQFSPFKALAKFTGQDLPIYQQNEAGEMVPQSAADRLESELNDELRDVRVGCYFEQVLRATCAAGILFQGCHLSMDRQDSTDLRLLWERLVAIRDGTGLLEPAQPLYE